MTYIVFENQGEIDLHTITTLGVSVKDSESPIGFFGTGLKYAIATLMRNGVKVLVMSGETVCRFDTREKEIRGEKFNLISMNVEVSGQDRGGSELGFTTQLGKNWLPWMAYRELWSNCKDEGGEDYPSEALPVPRHGRTYIVLEGAVAREAWEGKHEWLLAGRPVEAMRSMEVYDSLPGKAKTFYYKNIKVAGFDVPGVFTYNLQEKSSLTEDRTMDTWSAKNKIRKMFLHECRDRHILEAVLTAKKETLEGQIDWAGTFQEPSEFFVETVQRLMDTDMAVVNLTAIRACKGKITEVPRQVVALNKLQSLMLDKAKAFLLEIGHDVQEPIVVLESLGDRDIHGLAKGKVIYLPLVLFEKGTKYVASTLLEEHLHCKHGFLDESRDFQTYLLDRIITMGEMMRQEPL